jgi:hypothetical protein
MTLKRSIDYKDQLLTFKQLEGVIARKDIIIGSSEAIVKQAKINDFSWESAAQAYATFTKDEQTDIRKSGQQLLAGYYDPLTNTRGFPGANPTEARGIMITQMYLNQDRCCAYSGDGPYHILDFQVEHIDPIAGDHPENIVLVLANINENKKQSAQNFIERCERRYEMGELEYTIWYKSMKDAVKRNHKMKAEILSMSEHELCQYWLTRTTPKYDKYVWRNIGMSSLSEFRILKTSGIKRAGGTQGNYVDILSTIAAEYLFGDPDLARDIYQCARLFRSNYLNGQIQNQDYALFNMEIIELSNHVHSGYNREKFYNNIVRNNYSWPHLK